MALDEQAQKSKNMFDYRHPMEAAAIDQQ